VRRTIPAIAVLGLALALTLSGCFANPLDQLTEGLVEGGVEQIIEDQTGVDVNIDGSGASLPDDWPADVPTVDGVVSFSASAEGTFQAAIAVSDLAAAESAITLLTDAGFTQTATFDIGEGYSTTTFENETYVVGLIIGPNEDGTAIVQYSIVPSSE